MFTYFWERQRWSENGGGAERETQNLKQAPGSELTAHSLMQGSNPWLELKSLNRVATQVPHVHLSFKWISPLHASSIPLLLRSSYQSCLSPTLHEAAGCGQRQEALLSSMVPLYVQDSHPNVLSAAWQSYYMPLVNLTSHSPKRLFLEASPTFPLSQLVTLLLLLQRKQGQSKGTFHIRLPLGSLFFQTPVWV